MKYNGDCLTFAVFNCDNEMCFFAFICSLNACQLFRNVTITLVYIVIFNVMASKLAL